MNIIFIKMNLKFILMIQITFNVDYFSRALNAFHDNEENDSPRKQQAKDNPPLNSATIIHRGSCVQCRPIPKVCGFRRSCTLWNICTIYLRASWPRQWILKQKATYITFSFHIFMNFSFLLNKMKYQDFYLDNISVISKSFFLFMILM